MKQARGGPIVCSRSHVTLSGIDMVADVAEHIAEQHIHWGLTLSDRTLLTYPSHHVDGRSPKGMLVSV